jgi:hypothetical protein
LGSESDTKARTEATDDSPPKVFVSPMAKAGPDLRQAGNLAVQSSALAGTLPGTDPAYGVCEPIPDNPLAAYPFLAMALDRAWLQSLEAAAYRREHLRRGVPYNGPKGLFFAQGPLSHFLPPGSEYVSKEELLEALMPGMFAAARERRC